MAVSTTIHLALIPLVLAAVDEVEELQQLLESSPVQEGISSRKKNRHANRPMDDDDDDEDDGASADSVQWEIGGDKTYRATGATCKSLPAGVYTIGNDNRGLYLSEIELITDTLVDLGGTASKRIIQGIRDFWKREEKYRARGVVYKRGVLAWGPAGAGKTAAISILIKELIDANGLVLFVKNPSLATSALKAIRRIEHGRRLIVVLEDIEETIDNYGEHELLALLDGEHQVENVVYVATTNYPERLGKRIINRPSRFDEVFKVDMPNPVERKKFLEHRFQGNAGDNNLDQWVADSVGFSIAHLKELFISVALLEKDYSETVRRLKGMARTPKSSDKDLALGFGGEDGGECG